MTTTRAALCLSSAILLALAVSAAASAQGAPSREAPGSAAASGSRRPAGGLLSHSFSDFAEDNFGLAPERPEASPEPAPRKHDPAVPPPRRLPQ